MAVIATSSFTVSLGGSSTATGSLAQVNAITGGAVGSPLFDVTASFASTLTGGNSLLPGTIYLPHSLTLNTSALGSAGSVTVGSSFFDISASSGELIKDGVGTLVLTAPDSYTGGTEVKAGTLQLNGASLTGTVTVDGSAILDIAPTPGNSSSILGHVQVATGGTVQVDLVTNTSLEFLSGSGISVATGGTALLRYAGTNATLTGASSDLAAGTSLPGSTIQNFQLGDRLVLSDFTDVRHTSVSATSAVLTVTDTTHSAEFSLTGSLSADPAETVVLLRNSTSGRAIVTPAIKVTDALGDDTGAGSLRHALAVIAASGGNGEVVLFDHTISGSTITVGGLLPGPLTIPVPTNLPVVAMPGAVPTVNFDVLGGDKVTINGSFDSVPGGLHAISGFSKVGAGSLTLVGDQIALGGTVTVGAGALDLETSVVGSLSFAFKTGVDATIAGTSATLGGRSFDGFQLGDSINLKNFDAGSSTSFGFTGSSITVSAFTPEFKSFSATLNLTNSATDYVLLRDSTDGSALIRPALAATTTAALQAAVATITTLPYSDTSGDVIDLSGASLITLSGALALGTNPILFYVPNAGHVTINGSLSGTDDFFKAGAGTLTLQGDQSGLLGTISVGGGELVIGTTQFSSTVTAVDLAPGHGTVEGTSDQLAGLHVSHFHLGNAIHFIPSQPSDTITSSFPSIGGNITLNDSLAGTGNKSLTIGFSPSSVAGGGFTGVAVVPDGVGGQLIVPAVASGQTISGGAGELGSATDILTGGTLDLTGHGATFSQFYGGGTLKLDMPKGDQVVQLTSSDPGLGSTGNFTGQIVVNTGILDIHNVTTLHGSLTVGLAGSHSGIMVNATNSSQHLTFSAIAPGSAIALEFLSYNPGNFLSVSGSDSAHDTVDVITMSGSTTAVGYEFVIPHGALSTAGGGGVQLLADSTGGTVVAFGNDTINVVASNLFAGTTLSNGFKPTTVVVGGVAPGTPPLLDLTTVAFTPSIRALDVTSLGSTTVRVTVAELGTLSTITGAAATLQVIGSGTIDASSGFHMTGVQSVDFAGPSQTLSIGGGIGSGPPAGLKFIHGFDATDLITGPGQILTDTMSGTATSLLDLSGIAFSGQGHVVGSALTAPIIDPMTQMVLVPPMPMHTEYRITDGGLITHIDTWSGNDTINIVDTAQLSANFTADEIGYAFANNFVVERNGVVLSPTAAFTPPGGSPAISMSGLLSSVGISPTISGSVATYHGGLSVTGTTHLVLPAPPAPGGTLDFSQLVLAGGSAANPIVLFGAPGSSVILPSVVPNGQPSLQYVVNGGNNTITVASPTTPGSAAPPVVVWGGGGNDVVTLTNGAGTLVGGSGTANLIGGSASGTSFGGSGTVELFGASGGGTLSGGGDFSTLVSNGGHTVFVANSAALAVGGSIPGAIHQLFAGSSVADPLASDQFQLSSVSGSHDLVIAGPNSSTVIGGGGDETVIGGKGSILVSGSAVPGSTEHLLFEANSSSGGLENSTINGGTAAQLIAFGGDGHDSLIAGTGSSTLVGGSGNEFFFGPTGSVSGSGSGYILSQTSHDSFEFGDSSVTIPGAGRYVVEGFDTASEILRIETNSMTQNFTNLKAGAVSVTFVDSTSTVTGSTFVPVIAGDTYRSHLIGQTALELTLQDGVKIDLVGVSLAGLTASNLVVTSLPAL